MENQNKEWSDLMGKQIQESWEVTELSSHVDKFKGNNIKEILYGNPYITHYYRTEHEADLAEGILTKRGISSYIAHRFSDSSDKLETLEMLGEN